MNIMYIHGNGKYWGWIGAGLLLTAALALSGCGASSAPTAEAHVNTAKVVSGEISGSVSGVGRLIAHQDVNLAFQASGVVKTIDVKLGDKVKAGDPLVQLDDTDANRALSQAQNALDEANLKVAAAQNAYNTNAGWKPNDLQIAGAEAAADNAAAAVQAAQSNYDQVAWSPWVSSTQQSMALQQATNNYNEAKSNLNYLLTNRPDVTPSKINLDLAKLGVFDAQFGRDAAQSMLNKMTLSAPFDGTVTAINVGIGETPAGPAVRMITADDLEVVINLDEADVRSLAVGQAATITLDAWPDSHATGKVTFISPESMGGQAGSVVDYEVRLSIDQNSLPLRAGLSVQATIHTFDQKNVLLVPSGAILADRDSGKYYVNRVTAQGTRQTQVTIGAQDGTNTQILSGVQAGDVVEVDGTASQS